MGAVRTPNRSQNISLLERPRQLSGFSLSSIRAEPGIVFKDAEPGTGRTIAELGWRPHPCADCKWPLPWFSSSPSPGLSPFPQSESARRPECQPYVSDAGLPHSEPEGLFGREHSVKAVFIHTRARRLFIMQNYTLFNTQASKAIFCSLGEAATWAVRVAAGVGGDGGGGD